MSNLSGNFTGCQPQTTNMIIPIFMGCSFLIGFVLNCISLWIFWFKIKQWNSMVVLQFNLAISDSIITPIAPLIIIYYLTNRWTFGLFFCQLRVFLISTNVFGSIYFLTLISIHRYFSVAHSKRSNLIKKPFITKVCIGVWVYLLIQGIPFFFVFKISEVHGVTKCFSFHQTEQAASFFTVNWFVLFLGVLTPFSITLVCYTLLIRYILKVNPMNTLSKVMVSKSVRTIFISLIIIIICFIPLHITRTINFTIMFYFPDSCSLLESVEFAYYVAATVSMTNCCLDPILYCFASNRFKNIFTSWRSFVQRQQQRNTTNYEGRNDIDGTLDNHGHLPLPTISTTESGLSKSDGLD